MKEHRVIRVQRAEHAAAICAMCHAPSAASTTNQSTMTGPNSRPTDRRAVPLDPEQHDQDHDRQRHDVDASADGAAISRPSTAEITEIAGVITASP